MENTEQKKYYFVAWNRKAVCFSTMETAVAFKNKVESNGVCSFIGIEIIASVHNPGLPVHESVEDFKDLKTGEFPFELEEEIDIMELKGNKMYFFCYDFRNRESICFDSLEDAVKEQIHLTNHSRYKQNYPIYIVIGDYFSYGSKVCHGELKDDNEREQFHNRNTSELLHRNWNKGNYPNRMSLLENESFKKKENDEFTYYDYKLAYFADGFPTEIMKKYIDLEYESYKKHAIDHAEDCNDLMQFRVALWNKDDNDKTFAMSRGTDGDEEFKEKIASVAEKRLEGIKNKELLERIQKYVFYCGMGACFGRCLPRGFDNEEMDWHMRHMMPSFDSEDEERMTQIVADEILKLPYNLLQKIVGKLDFNGKTEPKEKTGTTEEKWKVVIFNDNTTPFGYIFNILENVFGKTHEEAEKLSIELNNSNKCVVDECSKEDASKKITTCLLAARLGKYDDFKIGMENEKGEIFGFFSSLELPEEVKK